MSSLNAPNLSWSLALLPWLCWAGDRLAEMPGRRSAVVLAVVAALQALSGEPVTLAASVAVLIVHVIAARRTDVRPLRVFTWLAAALVLGAALSSAQMIPTVLAGIRAGRATWSEVPDFWSLHPLAALEAVVPHLFGNYYTAFLADMPWMTALNSGREPFFYSIYVGPLVMLLACAGAIAAPRRSTPWVLLVLVFGIAAAGHYTPMYPAARRLVHPLAFFRFPIKYLSIAFFAVAVLAAQGCDAVAAPDGSSRRVRRVAIAAGTLAAAMAVALLTALRAQPLALDAARALASRLHLENPTAGAAYLVRFGEPLAARSIGVLLAGAALLAIASDATSRRRRIAWAALLALAIGDLTITNASLNPTIDAAKMQPPSWYTQMASHDRVYVGGRVRGFMDADDEDGSPGWNIPAEPTAIAGRAVLNAQLPMDPSGYRVREAVSYDLPVLLPAEYGAAMRRFVDAPPEHRAAFLRRSGVRWCVLPDDRSDGEIVAEVPDWHMHVTICDPSAVRAFVAFSAGVDADPALQQDALFDSRLSDALLKVDAVPQTAGVAGAAAAPAVTIVKDRTNEVELAASLPQAGFVVLLDSFDPGWTATVDGHEAAIARANSLYRAVRVTAGTHVIRFVYRPRILAGGLTLTGIAIVLCCLFAAPRRRAAAPVPPRRRGGAAESGFTLLELMVVMALIGILLAIAFARYHGMRARANETSADSALRTIATAQWTFALTCGHEKYATTLPSLAQPIPSTGQAFLSPDLTAAEQVEHSGYLFQMSAKPVTDAPPSCSGVPVGQGYAVTADPISPGVSGTRFFAINADRIVYADEKQTFTGNMPESGAPEHGAEVPRPGS